MVNKKIFLLLGPEEGDKKEALDEIKKELYKAYPDLEEESYYANDDQDAILSTLHQPSLFSSFRVIIINHLEIARKDSALIKGLKEYTKEAEDDVALIILSSESTSPFTKTEEERSVDKRIFYEQFESDKIAWITSTFRKEGFSVTRDAIEEILSSVENNKAEMKNLITLLSSYYRGKDETKKVIDSDDVASVITREKGENGYTLFKAVGKRNLEEALMIISSIALNDPSRLIGILSTLLGEFRTAENILEKRKKGLSEKEIQAEAHGLQTTPFAIKGFNFRRKDGLYAAIKNYSADEIEHIIIYLIKSDNELKKAGSDAKETFQDIIYNIIVNGGKENSKEIYQSLEVKLV